MTSMYNLHSSLINAISQGDINDVRMMLLGHELDVNYKDGIGETPLLHAAWHGHVEIMRLLLDHGANIESENRTASTALSVASKKGYTQAARLLIDRGADIEARDFIGWTPLISAAGSGHDDIVLALLNRGADTSLVDASGYKAIHYAIENRRHHVLGLLLGHGESPDGVMPDGKTFDQDCIDKPECLAVLEARRNALAIEKIIEGLPANGSTIRRPPSPFKP